MDVHVSANGQQFRPGQIVAWCGPPERQRDPIVNWRLEEMTPPTRWSTFSTHEPTAVLTCLVNSAKSETDMPFDELTIFQGAALRPTRKQIPLSDHTACSAADLAISTTQSAARDILSRESNVHVTKVFSCIDQHGSRIEPEIARLQNAKPTVALLW